MANYKPTTGAGLALTFDNVRTSLTASQSDETIPATGEFDNGQIVIVSGGQAGDRMQVSADSGSNYSAQSIAQLSSVEFNDIGEGVTILAGNSTGRYKIVCDATCATRIYSQMVATFA